MRKSGIIATIQTADGKLHKRDTSQLTLVSLGQFNRAKRRFSYNINRIETLLGLHGTVEATNEAKRDLLRAAVVLLHATTEDTMRGLIAWKLPHAPETCWEAVGYDKKQQLMSAGTRELTKYRGKTINEVLAILAKLYVDQKLFNHVGDVKAALPSFSIKGKTKERLADLADKLEPIMTRRHKIVHQSDREDGGETDHGKPRKIAIEEVTAWILAAKTFFAALFETLEAIKA